MDSLAPEQRQALQEAHEAAIASAVRHSQQEQQELHDGLASLQNELDRMRGTRRTEAGLTGKPISLHKNGGWAT